MNKWVVLGIAAAVLVIVAGYLRIKEIAGNKVQITDVVAAAAASPQASVTSPVRDINGKWSITKESKVFFTVKTSMEGVNFELPEVSGFWNVNLADPSKMTAEAKAPLTLLSSGNGQRDADIKGPRYLNVLENPDAPFKVSGFESFPAQWAEGETVTFKMTGTLILRGNSKEVAFDCTAIREAEKLSLSGTSKVTFQDFGMTNPHNVLLDTENDVKLTLQIVLARA